MPFAKLTRVDQIEIDRNDIIGVRLALEITEDGEVLNTNWHRFTIMPSDDFKAVTDSVNAHLSTMKMEAIAPGGIDRIRAVATSIWAK